MEKLKYQARQKLWAAWSIAKLLLRVIAPIGFRQAVRVKSPDILFVGPAAMSIPPKGWGAVETVINDQIMHLEQAGLRVALLNSTFFLDWLLLFGSRPKVAYCHYDRWAYPFLLLCKLYGVKSVSTSHYAYASQIAKWNKAFGRNISILSQKSALFVCLSPQISRTLRKKFPSSNFVTLPNRMATSPMPRETKTLDLPSRIVVLGKVEPRKSQIMLAHLLDEDFLNHVDFVGPVVDSNFVHLPESKKRAFLGEWTREEVWRNLRNYRFVMLPSEAEADALVLHEALLAGCEVITTPSAIGSQDRLLPHVHVVDLESPTIDEKLRDIIKLNPADPESIRALAQESSLWDEGAAMAFAVAIFSR